MLKTFRGFREFKKAYFIRYSLYKKFDGKSSSVYEDIHFQSRQFNRNAKNLEIMKTTVVYLRTRSVFHFQDSIIS